MDAYAIIFISFNIHHLMNFQTKNKISDSNQMIVEPMSLFICGCVCVCFLSINQSIRSIYWQFDFISSNFDLIIVNDKVHIIQITIESTTTKIEQRFFQDNFLLLLLITFFEIIYVCALLYLWMMPQMIMIINIIRIVDNSFVCKQNFKTEKKQTNKHPNTFKSKGTFFLIVSLHIL